MAIEKQPVKYTNIKSTACEQVLLNNKWILQPNSNSIFASMNGQHAFEHANWTLLLKWPFGFLVSKIWTSVLFVVEHSMRNIWKFGQICDRNQKCGHWFWSFQKSYE